MKIEKISDNQIKCTLNKSDLASREIKISELAYGTEKAKKLFRDMMQQAAYELGFEAEDIPLMIEAIPVSQDSIVLVITKVEDPEELDTRFSKFAPAEDDNQIEHLEDGVTNNELIDLFKQIKNETFLPFSESMSSLDDEKLKSIDKNNLVDENGNPVTILSNTKESKEEFKAKFKKQIERSNKKEANLFKLYSFNDLNVVIDLSKILSGVYNGKNSLYKENQTHTYYLILNQSSHTVEDFTKICNIVSEYGKPEKTTYAREAYCKEHLDLIADNEAIQKMGLLIS